MKRFTLQALLLLLLSGESNSEVKSGVKQPGTKLTETGWTNGTVGCWAKKVFDDHPCQWMNVYIGMQQIDFLRFTREGREDRLIDMKSKMNAEGSTEVWLIAQRFGDQTKYREFHFKNGVLSRVKE